MQAIEAFRDDLLASIVEHRGDVKTTALVVRNRMRDCLASEDFVAASWRWVIERIRCEPLWYKQPLIASIDPLVNVHLIFWPPQFRNNPHRHNTWSVTGVVHNAVKVRTFHFADDENAQLEQDRLLGGEAGDVGYLLPGCIHSVSNESDAEACTLHVFGGEDDEGVVTEHTIWYPSRGEGEMARGARARAIRIMVEWALANPTAAAIEVLAECCDIADTQQCLEIVKRLSSLDSRRAYEKSIELEQRLRGPDRVRLGAINRELAKAWA